MLEIFGVFAILALAVVLGKSIRNFFIKRTMWKATEAARNLGVPHAFIIESFNHLDHIKDAITQLGQLDSEFHGKPVFSQFGEAIALNYEGQLGGHIPRYPGLFNDYSENFDEVVNRAVDLGVPRNLVSDLYVKHHADINKFASQIDSPSSAHHNASFEERLAVSISTLYRLQHKTDTVSLTNHEPKS